MVSNSSSDLPLVSGMRKMTHNNCSTIINAKKAKMGPGPIFTANIGKTVVMIAAIIQCVDAPSDCP